jgi:lysophospholipase L1-like esterase
MKYISLLIVLILAYFLFEIGVFWYKFKHLPVLEDFKHTELTLGQGPSLRYIAAGDSSAVGMGASSVENCYANKVAAELAKTHLVTYKNIAVTGSTTQDVLDKQIQQIIDFKPNIVTISIGGNDATHMVSGATILEHDKEIIQALVAKTSATIYLTVIPNFHWATVLPWFYRQLIEYKSGKTNPEIMKLETDRVKIVNIHDFGWSKFPNILLTNAPDSFHPSDLGYENWTDAFLSKINGRSEDKNK